MFGKFILEIDRLLFWLLMALLLGGFVFKIRGERPPKDLGNCKLELRLNWFGSAMYSLIAVSIPNMAKAFVFKPSLNLPIFLSIAAGLIVALLATTDFPGGIVLGPEGLEQRHWLRRNIHILWKDIVEVESERGGSITIKSSNGARIIHTIFLSGRSLLLRELKLHCGDELPANFPGEALDA